MSQLEENHYYHIISKSRLSRAPVTLRSHHIILIYPLLATPLLYETWGVGSFNAVDRYDDVGLPYGHNTVIKCSSGAGGYLIQQ